MHLPCPQASAPVRRFLLLAPVMPARVRTHKPVQIPYIVIHIIYVHTCACDFLKCLVICPTVPLRGLDRGRSSELLVFDCKFTYCFTAHMHEITKYFLSTENQEQCLHNSLGDAHRPVAGRRSYQSILTGTTSTYVYTRYSTAVQKKSTRTQKVQLLLFAGGALL